MGCDGLFTIARQDRDGCAAEDGKKDALGMMGVEKATESEGKTQSRPLLHTQIICSL